MRDNRNNIYISSLNDNQEYHEQYWRQQTNKYMELKNEITATVTNHANKLIDDLEMNYQQMKKRMEKRQEEALEMVFNRLDKTLDNINRQTNFRTENEQLFNNRNIDNIANENILITNIYLSLRSLALRIETLVKTAYSLYTEEYRNSVMNQTFIRCLDNELKTAALKKHANLKQTPREPEMPFKALVEKIDQMDLTRTITNNHKRLYEVNQSTSNINDDLKQMNIACNNINELNQNDLEQFEGTICNVLNGINNTYDKKNFKGRPKFALFCSYCSSHGHTKGRCFKRPRRESIARPKERSFYGHMRNNQNLPNRKNDSNNINGRQLPPTSPIYNNSRSRTPYRLQSRNNYNNNVNPRDNRNYQGYRKSHNYNNRSTSYNRNNYSRSRGNSYNRNNNHNRYNSRSGSRYTDRNNSRQQSPYNRNNNYNNNNRRRYNSRDSNRNDRFRQHSSSNNRNYSNNNNRDDRRNSSQREQNQRNYSTERRNEANKYNNNNNKNRINNIKSEKQNDDPPGIDEYEYTSESSDEDQEILDKFYNANEDTCNTLINTLESNPTWILPIGVRHDFQKGIFNILKDSLQKD